MLTERLRTFFVFTLLLGTCVYGQSKKKGDTCEVKNGASGTCVDLKECPSAQEARAKGERPFMCSAKSKTEMIVCCKISSGVKSKEKCTEYGRAVFLEEDATTLLDAEPSIGIPTCAQAGLELIVGGTKCLPKEFPHMAALGYGEEDSKQWLCGGSLISERYILTAAHCISSQGRGAVKWALLGDLNYENDYDDTEPMLIEVIDRIKHPDYTASSHYNDIALLKLKEDVVFTTYVRPACLNTNYSATPLSRPVVATGWGLLKHDTTNLSPDLMKVTLRVVESSTCSKVYGPIVKFGSKLLRGIEEATMMCVGDTNGGKDGIWKDTCGGDSGGPLHLNLASPYCMYSIVGITSFGNAACGHSPAPAVYTRVSYFVPWIESIVWPN